MVSLLALPSAFTEALKLSLAISPFYSRTSSQAESTERVKIYELFVVVSLQLSICHESLVLIPSELRRYPLQSSTVHVHQLRLRKEERDHIHTVERREKKKRKNTSIIQGCEETRTKRQHKRETKDGKKCAGGRAGREGWVGVGETTRSTYMFGALEWRQSGQSVTLRKKT